MPYFDDSSYYTKSAVLFIIFNRPETTSRVFDAIRNAKPSKLYIAADAARNDKPGEDFLCEQTRLIINKVDWDCEVKTLFQEQNLGCRGGVPAAIDWFFSQEEEGIILEDDCLPGNSFFKFCDVMLTQYRDNMTVRHITGCNLQFGKKWGDASYYFSNRSHVWGWASWKRVWQDYDRLLSKLNVEDFSDKIRDIYQENYIVDNWTNIFNEVKAGKINAWAHQLDIANFLRNGLTIIPNQNLIKNIGFGKSATHTLDENSPYANIPMLEMTEIVHPAVITPQKEADLVIFHRDFKNADTGAKKEKKGKFLKNKIKNLFKMVFLWLKNQKRQT